MPFPLPVSSDKVPYVGATSAVDLGAENLSTTGDILANEFNIDSTIDHEIYDSSDDLIFKNLNSNKDMYFSLNDGGVQKNMIHVDSSNYSIKLFASRLQIADNQTDDTNKQGLIAIRHWDNSAFDFLIFGGISKSTTNSVRFGGGSSFNAATEIRYYTAANNTTLTGTQRWTITSAGHFVSSSDGSGAYDFITAGNISLSVDNAKFLLGQTDDVEMYYDNSKFVIDDTTTQLISFEDNSIELSGTINITGGRAILSGAGGGEAQLQSGQAIYLVPNNDTDDFFTFTTLGHVPTIGTVGSCNLKITASSGVIDVDDELLMATTEKLNFRDVAIGIYSQADSFLDIFADGGIRLGNSSAGAPTTYIDFEANGDVFWVGDSSGIPYGSMYNDDTSTNVTIGAINTPVRIPSGFTVGQTNLSTFQNNREIVVTKAGRYLITWSISFSTDGNAKEIEGFVMIDNVRNAQAAAHRYVGTGTDTGDMGGTCVLDLAASAVVALGVLNETAGGDLDVNVEHANLSIIMVGGT